MKVSLDSLALVLLSLAPSAGCSGRGALSIGAPEPGDPEPTELALPTNAEAGARGEQPPLRAATSASGRYTLRWRPLAPEVPTNEPFELEFFLERDGASAPGAGVVVRGWMPEHGHGMVRRPEVIDRGDGSYLVRGMLLHMGGLWELFFDVYEPGARKDRVRFEIQL